MNLIKCYIAGPIAHGDLKHNYQQAVDAAYKLLETDLFAVYVPHLFMPANKQRMGSESNLDDVSIREKGVVGEWFERFMRQDSEWVAACDVLLRLPGFSGGADREVAVAKEHNKPVFEDIHELVSWAIMQVLE